jgi:hypothetical protein
MYGNSRTPIPHPKNNPIEDYSETWLIAQRAHKDYFEAALKGDWHSAMRHAELLEAMSWRLSDWAEEQILAKVP